MSFTIFRKFLVIIDLIFFFPAPKIFSFLIGTPETQMLYIFPMISKVLFIFLNLFFFPLFLGNLDKLGSLYWFICEYTNSSNISIMLSSLSSELFNSGIMSLGSKILICFFLKISLFLL